ncbi:MAG TPA: lytic transglycosylase domain-containing protein [Pyrinomonadaceae bacterium]|jgi:soluble lytic murein transglycosylase|nr:lytic transglycosylase domain-containing protein [Pyrinomonadaceae bacterium]
MKRYLISILIIVVVVALPASYFFREYWEHRFDEIISRQAAVYRLDDRLVWSVIYEETWFRSWKLGAQGEVGLMQVTPLVARDWAHETGLRDLERQANENAVEFLRDPERNIQIGCWYLEKLREQYRGLPAETAMALAAYNAGPSRVEEWSRGNNDLSESAFVDRINIGSTKSYVISILNRYRNAKPLAGK